MKKLLSLMLVFVMLFSFAACGGAGSDEDQARKVADDFFGAFMDLRIGDMDNYLEDPSILPSEFKDLNLDPETLMDGFPAEMDDYKDDFVSVFETLVNKFKSILNYKILSSKEDNGSYIFELELTIPDDSTDFESLFSNAINSEKIQAIMMEAIEKDADLLSDQQALLDAVMPEIITLFKETIENIDINTTTTNGTIRVSKVNDKWMIVEVD